MKYTTKIILITALGLILAGVLLSVGTIAIAGLPFGQDYRTYRTEHDAALSAITTDLGAASVCLKPTSGEKIIVICNDIEDERRITVTERDGVLHIEYDPVPWFLDVRSWISFGEDPEYDVEIAIPERYAGTLDIETNSGRIEGSDVSAAAAEFEASSGAIRLYNLHCDGELAVDCTSGRIELERINTGGDLAVSSTSGYTLLKHVTVECNLTVDGTSGSLQLENVTAGGSISADLTSGSINAISIVCGDSFSLGTVSGVIRGRYFTARSIAAEATSGLIRLQVMDAEAIRLETTSGSIQCSVPDKQEAYSITSSTVSGANALPEKQTGGGKTLDVHTTSGSIRIDFDRKSVSN